MTERAKSVRTESAVSRGEGADRNRTGVRDLTPDLGGIRVDVAELRRLLPFTTSYDPCCSTDELVALLDVAEAAAWYWRDPSPDAHESMTQALARLDFGDSEKWLCEMTHPDEPCPKDGA